MRKPRSMAFVVLTSAHTLIIPTLHARLLPRSTGDDNSGGTKGANYFFGFLITFVVLLLVFAGCGIGSRRRLLMRLQTSQTARFEMSALPSDAGERTPPTFFESTLQRLSSSSANLREIIPLSATFLYKDESQERATSRPLTNISQAQNSRTLFSRLSSLRPSTLWLSNRNGRRDQKQLTEPLPLPDERKSPHSIQLAVVIEMPSRPRRTSLNIDEKTTPSIVTLPPSNIQLGVATISSLDSGFW